MRRRLRKKRKVGEYAEFGFMLIARFPIEWTPDHHDTLLMDMIDFVESRQLGIGGGPDTGAFVHRLCTRRRCTQCNRRYGTNRNVGPVTVADQDDLTTWLIEHGALEAKAGPLVDANHGSESDYDDPKLECA
jgi:uncharacterized protein YggL (DUF469 family)